MLTDIARVDPAVHSECAAARTRVFDGYAAVLARAQRDGLARDDLTAPQLQRLVCGLEHAVRLGAPSDRDVLLDILLAGLRPASPTVLADSRALGATGVPAGVAG